MARPLSNLSLNLLNIISQHPGLTFHEIKETHTQAESNKTVYDALFRLQKAGLLNTESGRYILTPEGQQVIHKKNPQRDGVWKLIIFDIPERQRYVRNFLRQRLTSLGFKKWQNSIWVSPYRLDEELELELKELAEKFFVRLIKTTDINYTNDLEKLFPDNAKTAA
jgi:DNA-binding transcriptional regulator PaaX